jgi:hypothetical protein
MPGEDGQGGGAGGGGGSTPTFSIALGAAGGGVGILGQGASGLGGQVVPNAQPFMGGGGSGGVGGIQARTWGGEFGGGGAWRHTQPDLSLSRGAGGAVRIIWPGNTRQFPNTLTENI